MLPKQNEVKMHNKYEETNIFPCGENIPHDERYSHKGILWKF